MIFNMMGSLVTKDAEWIPLTNGVQTRAVPPANWVSYSFTLDRQPSIVVLKTHYGGADTYAVIDWFGRFGFGIVNENCFRNASIYYTVGTSYPATVTLEIQGGPVFYCPIYDSE